MGFFEKFKEIIDAGKEGYNEQKEQQRERGDKRKQEKQMDKKER